MIVREFVKNDLNAVYAIASRSLDEFYNRSVFMFFHEQWPQGQLVCTNDRGEIVGFINSTKLAHRSVRINMIAVQPSYRGHGVGQMILNQFRMVMLMNGISEIELEVRAENSKAISFYKKNGFVESAVLNHYYSNGGNGIRMTAPVQLMN